MTIGTTVHLKKRGLSLRVERCARQDSVTVLLWCFGLAGRRNSCFRFVETKIGYRHANQTVSETPFNVVTSVRAPLNRVWVAAPD